MWLPLSAQYTVLKSHFHSASWILFLSPCKPVEARAAAHVKWLLWWVSWKRKTWNWLETLKLLLLLIQCTVHHRWHKRAPQTGRSHFPASLTQGNVWSVFFPGCQYGVSAPGRERDVFFYFRTEVSSISWLSYLSTSVHAWVCNNSWWRTALKQMNKTYYL